MTVASGFPFTRIVNVSSFSVVIKLPNQDFFVSSGDDSGVKWTSSDEAASIDGIKRQKPRPTYFATFFDGNVANLRSYS